MPVTWDEFQRKAVPETIRRREAQKNRFVPLSRWIAVREAFVLHHLGMTGNMVSLLRIALALVALYFYSQFAGGDLRSAFVGIVLMAWQLNLDGVDGALARAQDKASDFGNALDNLGIDFVRTCFFVLAGNMTGDTTMVILTSLAGCLLVPFRQNTVGVMGGRVDRFVSHFIYVPVIWVIVPGLMLAVSASGFPAASVTYWVAAFYVALAAVWFLSCLRDQLFGSAGVR